MKIVEITKPLNVATELIRRYGGRKIRFGDLPATAQKAIITRGYENLEPGANPRINPNRLVGYVEIPIEALKNAVFANLEAGHPFQNFDEYHQWYVGHRDTPDHTEIWPIELETEVPNEMGLIHDGSHRFHSYVRRGVQVVPAIYN